MNNNEKLDAIAQKVLDKVSLKEGEHGIITILMIVSIILTSIRILQECNKNKLMALRNKEKTTLFAGEIQSAAIRKSWFNRLKLRKIVRKELGKEAYVSYGPEIVDAIFEVGSSLDTSELYTLAEVINV